MEIGEPRLGGERAPFNARELVPKRWSTWVHGRKSMTRWIQLGKVLWNLEKLCVRVFSSNENILFWRRRKSRRRGRCFLESKKAKVQAKRVPSGSFTMSGDIGNRDSNFQLGQGLTGLAQLFQIPRVHTLFARWSFCPTGSSAARFHKGKKV